MRTAETAAGASRETARNCRVDIDRVALAVVGAASAVQQLFVDEFEPRPAIQVESANRGRDCSTGDVPAERGRSRGVDRASGDVGADCSLGFVIKRAGAAVIDGARFRKQYSPSTVKIQIVREPSPGEHGDRDRTRRRHRTRKARSGRERPCPALAIILTHGEPDTTTRRGHTAPMQDRNRSVAAIL
jgi:hypothetical protein